MKQDIVYMGTEWEINNLNWHNLLRYKLSRKIERIRFAHFQDTISKAIQMILFRNSIWVLFIFYAYRGYNRTHKVHVLMS